MSTAVPKTKTILIVGKEITIKKLSLGKLIKVLDALDELPKEFAEFDKKTNAEILASIPMIIAGSLPVFTKAIVKATRDPQVTERFLTEECGLDDVLELVEALLEVNRIDKIVKHLKNAKALTRPAK